MFANIRSNIEGCSDVPTSMRVPFNRKRVSYVTPMVSTWTCGGVGGGVCGRWAAAAAVRCGDSSACSAWWIAIFMRSLPARIGGGWISSTLVHCRWVCCAGSCPTRTLTRFGCLGASCTACAAPYAHRTVPAGALCVRRPTSRHPDARWVCCAEFFWHRTLFRTS